MRLKGKHILIGVTGSIAAYKAATLVRLLVKEGAEVKVIMTALAKQFITPLTLATLSKNPILVDFFNPENGEWNSHVSLGMWADIYVIAPASANTLSKMANGVADNLLLTSYLSAKCNVMVAPAMDLDMYRHPATQRSLSQLSTDGVKVIEPNDGELASGLVGKGRMAEPEQIAEAVVKNLNVSQRDLEGKRVMITAGPTVENIDPIRYISNYSSGKMGYAIAEECLKRGAEVTLISGPVDIKAKSAGINVIKVKSALEMRDAAVEAFEGADYAILAAAVADYRPKVQADKKIKKDSGREMTIELVENPDIAATLGRGKRTGQVVVGFALETDNMTANATRKLESKNLDMIVLNSPNDAKSAFGYDTDKVTIINKDGDMTELPLMQKTEVAKNIIDQMKSL